jgi:hypothetical protein
MAFDVAAYFDVLSESGIFLLYHKGEITEKTSTNLLNELEKRSQEVGLSRGILKKVSHIFIESVQNLYHHSYKEAVDKYPPNYGIIQIKIMHDDIIIRSANIVTEQTKRFLKKRIDQLNILTIEQITKLYKIILNETSLSEKGGGGLGLIDIIKRTKNKINYSFKPVNGNLFFYIFEAKMNLNNK